MSEPIDDRILVYKYFVSYRFGYPIGLGIHARVEYEFGELVWDDDTGIMTGWHLDQLVDYIADLEISKRNYELQHGWRQEGFKVSLTCISLLATVKT